MSDIAIRADHLSKLYPAVKTDTSLLWALKDISFDVKQGEVVGIPSTSDHRSALRTRLKILSRITEPTSGRAETFGGRVASLLDASRGTGSQSDPELIGRENIRCA